jgi:hypothetical protein
MFARSSARWIEPSRFGWCLAVLLIMASSPVGATVLTGPIVDLPEATVTFYWGDGAHDLYQQWSVANKTSGWFYGSTYVGTSNADVYTYSGLTDPTMVTNAESFTYNDSAVMASEGDCVFFRGTNGFYGAWRIDTIDPLPGQVPPYAELNGQWYFQDNGTGNFSQATPVQGATWGAIKALLK